MAATYKYGSTQKPVELMLLNRELRTPKNSEMLDEAAKLLWRRYPTMTAGTVTVNGVDLRFTAQQMTFKNFDIYSKEVAEWRVLYTMARNNNRNHLPQFRFDAKTYFMRLLSFETVEAK